MKKYNIQTCLGGLRSIAAVVALMIALQPINAAAQYVLKMWGTNNGGELGIGTTSAVESTPVTTESTPVNGSKFFTASVGGSYILTIREDGSLWAWGVNWQAQLGKGSKGGYYSSPLMVHTGNGPNGKWIKVAACYNHSLGIREDGTLWGWGSSWGIWNGYDMLDVATLTAVQLDKGSGSKWIDVTGCGDMASFAGVGNGFGGAIRTDGKLFTWGKAENGVLGQGDGVYLREFLTPVPDSNSVEWTKILAGRSHFIGLRKDGSLWSWGVNYNGQLGVNNNDTKHRPVRVDWGTDISKGGKWTVIAAGSYHNAAIREDGSLWTWGANWQGQLGDGTTNDALVPKLIDNGASGKWVQVAAGYDCTLGMKADGTIWAWGNNANGMMANGTVISSPATQFYTPQRITALGTVQAQKALLICNANSSMAGLITDKGVVPPVCYAPNVKIDSVSTTTGRITWIPLPGVNYEVAVDQSATTAPAGTATIQTDTFFNVNNLTPGAKYYVHIRSNCGSGNYSRWDTLSFFAAQPCPKPTGLRVDLITNNSVDVYWNTTPRSIEYEVYIDQSATLSPSAAAAVTIDTFYFGASLNAATKYYVHVRNNCGGGNYSAWDTISFRTISNCTGTNILLVGNVTNNGADISWSGLPSAVDYDVAVDQSATLTPTGTITTQAATQYNATGLNVNATYYAHVRPRCGSGDYAAWDTISFHTTSGMNINRIIQAKDVSLYPNPVNSMLYVQSPVLLQAEVYSIDGRILVTISNTSSGIDFSDYTSGIYVIKLIDAQGNVIKVERVVR